MPTTRQTIARAETEPPFFAGIDLGGTNIKIGVVDNQGRTLSYITTPTDEVAGAESGIRRMAKALQEAACMANLQPGEIVRVGLGSPGPIDISSGMLLTPVNMPHWHNFPLRDKLSQHIGRPVTFANDASAAAFGEYWIGSARHVNSLVLLTLGTGIGGGIIIDGKSIDGAHSHGAECGHTIIDSRDDARLCSCGQTGHLEAYASATAIVKRCNEALASGVKTSINTRLEHGATLTALMIAEEAEASDPLALEIVLDTAGYLAIGIVTLMHTIDPEIVLLGGAMNFGGPESPLGQKFLGRIRDEVHRRAFPILAQQTAIEFASLGSDAGYIGAAGMARAEHVKQ